MKIWSNFDVVMKNPDIFHYKMKRKIRNENLVKWKCWSNCAPIRPCEEKSKEIKTSHLFSPRSCTIWIFELQIKGKRYWLSITKWRYYTFIVLSDIITKSCYGLKLLLVWNTTGDRIWLKFQSNCWGGRTQWTGQTFPCGHNLEITLLLCRYLSESISPYDLLTHFILSALLLSCLKEFWENQ